jgi:hypothetical protein
MNKLNKMVKNMVLTNIVKDLEEHYVKYLNKLYVINY